MPPLTRDDLFHAVKSFCTALERGRSPDELLKENFSITRSKDIFIHEYGLPNLAPFLGRDFRGPDGVKTYFRILSSHLDYQNMLFKEEDFIIDEIRQKVSARGRARFTWKSTQQSWDEVFMYVLGFDDSGKVLSYEIWADSGAAYLASKGQLDSR